MSTRNTYEAAAGTTIGYRAVGDNGTYTEFAAIDAIGGLPEQAADKFETTRVNQADLYKQYGFSWIEPGELQFVLALDSSQVDTIEDSLFLVDQEYQILFPSGAKVEFTGTIYRKSPTFEKGGEVKLGVTVQVQGAPVYTPAA